MSVPVHRCARHAGARAGWFCPQCRALLCPGCAFTRSASTAVQLTCCSRCGGMVELLTVRRAELRSFAARLPGALAATFSAGGLLTLLGTAAVMWLLGHLSLPGAILRLGVFWGLLFTAIRRACRGQPGLEPPDLSDVWHDLVRPALLGLLANALVIVPAVAWAVGRPGGLEAPLLQDPVLWALAAAAALYVPVALMQAALGASVGQMLNPVGVAVAAVRLGRDYLLAVGACVLLVLADVAALTAGAGLLGGIPVVSGVLVELLGLVAPALLARTLGLLLCRRPQHGSGGGPRRPAGPGPHLPAAPRPPCRRPVRPRPAAGAVPRHPRRPARPRPAGAGAGIGSERRPRRPPTPFVRRRAPGGAAAGRARMGSCKSPPASRS